MLRFIGSAALLLLGVHPAVTHAAEPADAQCNASNLRWSAVSNRLYVTGGARCTLTEIRRHADPAVPLVLVDAPKRIWLLGANLLLEGGSALVLDGSSVGGDVAELRLRSNNSSAPDAFVEVRAMWGTVTMRNTRLTSWDEDKGGPDTEYETYGRAFVRALSYLDGTTPRESRMDIVDSEIGHLGYDASESYGLVWKVRGETAGIFDLVDVLGDVTGSVVHDNYFGMYTFGAYGMNIVGNEFSDNVMYGVDPHDDSDALVVENNNIHDNGNHGFICSMRCDGLTIRSNVSSSNAGVGFMLHRAVVNSVVEGNLAELNGTGGFAIVDSYDNVFRGNAAHGNQYGIRLSTGASDNLIVDNDLSDNLEYGIYTYLGADAPTVNDGRVARNRFVGNNVSRNGILGARADQSYMNEFSENTFEDNGQYAVLLFDANENVLRGNDLFGSYILTHGDASNYVADTDSADVMFADDRASLTFTDSGGRVFLNPEGVPTLVGADGSSLTLTGGAGIVTVDAVALAVSLEGGAAHVGILGWSGGARVWCIAPSGAARATFTVGDLEPGGRYRVRVDGGRLAPLVADASGSTWFAAAMDTAPHTYALTSIRGLASPRSAWPAAGVRTDTFETMCGK
ncbi:MAG: right-handed parallel beta-helix repeat-containing protein [Pseudomonadota bacterium]|nr:right-handed parallel beta-helix repeat-containing protein [Pseudomonadota bacterium]